MSLEDFYIKRIAQKKKGNTLIYEQTLVDLFGKKLTWEEVKQLEREQQMNFCIDLENRTIIYKSKYDIKKLARAIQHSRSGAGLCAMTEFECVFCGKKEWWGNTNVPNICCNCSEKMATEMVLSGLKIEKEKMS